jgi:hypothetical protein
MDQITDTQKAGHSPDLGYAAGYHGVTVTGRDGHLIQVDGYDIINTASPLFHSLTDVEAEKADVAKAAEEFDIRFILPPKDV